MYTYLLYDLIDDGQIAQITLNRPDKRNALNRGLLVELDDAFLRAEADDAVRVVVLRGAGKLFSAGHDLGSKVATAERLPGPGQHPSFQENGATREGVEQRTLQEWHHYFANSRRWRDLRKITIAAVHGEVFSGGLTLMWVCDLIVAEEGTVFADVVGTRLGMAGQEYFAHPWELGPRRAKELMLTGDSISADEAYRIGMVNKVFPHERFEDETLAFARRVAQMPTIASLMIKESVNQAQDQQGFYNSLQASFALHQVNHAHWMALSGNNTPAQTVETGGVPPSEWPPIRPAARDRA